MFFHSECADKGMDHLLRLLPVDDFLKTGNVPSAILVWCRPRYLNNNVYLTRLNPQIVARSLAWSVGRLTTIAWLLAVVPQCNGRHLICSTSSYSLYFRFVMSPSRPEAETLDNNVDCIKRLNIILISRTKQEKPTNYRTNAADVQDKFSTGKQCESIQYCGPCATVMCTTW